MESKTKVLNIRIPEDLHKSLKLEAVRRDESVKDMAIMALTTFLEGLKKEEEILIAEPLDEEDLKDMELGKDDIANGDYEDIDKVYKELEQS